MKRMIWILGVLIVVIGGWSVKHFVIDRSNVRAAPTATSYQGVAGKTVLDLLRERASVETTANPQLGEFVTSINGTKSGTNGKYWIYTINGIPTATVPSQYMTKPTESIEWKLE